MIFIFNEDEKEKWEYAKWLPHTWNADGSFRYIAASSDEVKELVNELEKEIDNRITHKEEDFPKLLIVASDKKIMDSLDIMPLMMKNRKQAQHQYTDFISECTITIIPILLSNLLNGIAKIILIPPKCRKPKVSFMTAEKT